MKLIAGLGNPGKQYRFSRHNLGFMVIDQMAQQHRVRYFWPRYLGRAAKIRINEEVVTLLKPYTLMNLSGQGVALAMKRLNLDFDQLIVVHDDLDLALGQIKLGFSLKSAGHKGLESIIQELGSKDFFRVRLGIGKPGDKEDVVDYVLKPFPKKDHELVNKTIEDACKAVEVLVNDGLEKAQNTFHKRS